ncbi:hypothetical protein N7478_009286 [Penicillium angulare]|uniref:uncharacterized protein n=1 Tax=Penicillium angulare TaxID=116970 RepID=UPI00253FF5DC|nr:uncharacterized protein N7478_009286 [Penicillium angulare]KAJ5266478.1 hypothetical protein N7478_009286 [Penicillium angulare]
MEFASLTRPAILCQCSRCSSSLAVLENEWAKLSNAYSLATAWLSVNFNRISVSSESKQIPPTPDMHLLRGRTTQEVTCKLCQQKLGALCTLDNGPNIFWKMSRVAFREVVTMRTAEPVFKEGALERYLCPAPKEIPGRDRTSIHDGALVPKSGSDPASFDSTMQQHMQHQGRSIDQISNSVNHLQDTMTDLKHSFTAMRIELNGPSHHLGENGNLNSHGFDMIATVLKELKSKSDEIEKLKLEIEALKLKNRFMEERKPSNSDYLSTMNGSLPEVKSPGLLQAGRKRAWPDAFSNDGARTVADSFGEEDSIEDLTLTNNPPTYLVSLPISESHAITNGQNQPQTTPDSSNFLTDNNEQRLKPDDTNHANGFSQTSPSKRLRLTETAAEETPQELPREKKRQARSRQSDTQSAKPNLSQTPKNPPAGSGEGVESNPPVQVPLSNHTTNSQPARRGRPRRSTRSHSTGPTEAKKSQTAKTDSSTQDSTKNQSNGDRRSSKKDTTKGNNADDSASENPTMSAEEKRKAKVAARDVMTRVAMQREEAMETDEIR